MASEVLVVLTNNSSMSDAEVIERLNRSVGRSELRFRFASESDEEVAEEATREVVIDDLDLSYGIKMALESAGVSDIAALLRLNSEDCLSIRGMTQRRYTEIQAALQKAGIS